MANDRRKLATADATQAAPGEEKNAFAVKAGGGFGGMRSPLAAGGARPRGGIVAPPSNGDANDDGNAGGNGGNGNASAPVKLGPGNQFAGQDSRAPLSKKPPDSKAGGPAEVSQIKGLSEQSHHLSDGRAIATHLSYVMYDTGRDRGRRFAKFVFLAIVAAVVGAVAVQPQWRDYVVDHLIEAKDNLVSIARHRKVKTHRAPVDRDTTVASNVPERAPAPVDESRPPVKHTCAELRSLVANAAGLVLAERVDAADCFLVTDDPLTAEETLKSLKDKIQRSSEAMINSPAQKAFGDAYLTLIAAMLKEGKTREVGIIIGRKCSRWAVNVACVGKLMRNAALHVTGDGSDMQTMFEERTMLKGKAQGYLWLAGAQIASIQGAPKKADQRYQRARSTAPKSAFALRKQIYETQAIDLYTRGEIIHLHAILKTAMDDLKSVPTEAKTKLQLLYDLSSATDRKKKAAVVRSILTREDVTYRARGDFDMIEILGPESMRAAVEDDYLHLLSRTRDFYRDKYHSIDSIGKRLSLWEIRANLSKGDFDRAAELLGAYEHAFPSDPVPHHLHGCLYANTSRNEKYQKLAAFEFQKALQLQLHDRSWESLYALGATWIRAGKPEAVPAIVKDLEHMNLTSGQLYWYNMLRAEYYVATGNYPKAQKILDEAERADPDWYTAKRLLLQLYEKQGKTSDANTVQASLDDLARGQPYERSFEGFASPLGPMSLAKRPVD